MTKRYVQPSKQGTGWDILKEGHRRALVNAPTEKQAVARASRLARAEGGGKILVKDRTGKVSDTVLVSASR